MPLITYLQPSWKIIKIRKIRDSRGNLSILEGGHDVPFAIKRIYYLYDTPIGKLRGGHAHKKLKQLLVAISGSFTVRVDDGKFQEDIRLSKPDEGLYLNEMTWREIYNFSSNAVCLVVASKHYDEFDYIRNYAKFKKLQRMK